MLEDKHQLYKTLGIILRFQKIKITSKYVKHILNLLADPKLSIVEIS